MVVRVSWMWCVSLWTVWDSRSSSPVRLLLLDDDVNVSSFAIRLTAGSSFGVRLRCLPVVVSRDEDAEAEPEREDVEA